MSISNILKSIVVISFGTVIGYGSIKFITPEEKNRFIASYPISKLGKDQNSRLLFDIKVNTDELALTENDISTIKVNVLALKNINSGLIYNWNLPNDVELINGYLNDGVGEFVANQSKEFTIRVRGFSKQFNKFISFEILGELEQRPIRREILISSRIEDSLEYAIQQRELNRSKNQMNKLDNSKNKFSLDRVIR